MTTMDLQIKSLKSCDGRNGPGAAFSCSLYIDGKRAAVVRNSGCGGCNDYDWIDRSRRDEFLAHCKAVSKHKFEQDDDVIGTLIDQMETDKLLKRNCRTKVVFRLASDGADDFRTLKHAWKGSEARVRAHLQKKHGSDLLEIVNERFA